jgi:hypothetical protein
MKISYQALQFVQNDDRILREMVRQRIRDQVFFSRALKDARIVGSCFGDLSLPQQRMLPPRSGGFPILIEDTLIGDRVRDAVGKSTRIAAIS